MYYRHLNVYLLSHFLSFWSEMWISEKLRKLAEVSYSTSRILIKNAALNKNQITILNNYQLEEKEDDDGEGDNHAIDKSPNTVMYFDGQLHYLDKDRQQSAMPQKTNSQHQIASTADASSSTSTPQ